MVVSTELYHIILFVPLKYDNSNLCDSVLFRYVICAHDIWIIITTFF